jgi:glycerol-3-phosphate dehydrogenase
LIRTADATIVMPANCPDFIRAGLERGTLAVPVEQLRRVLESAERRFRALVDESLAAEAARSEPTEVAVSWQTVEAPKARPMEMG